MAVQSTSSQNTLTQPLMGADGKLTYSWLQLFRTWMQQLSKGFDAAGNLISNLSQSVGLSGRLGTVYSITQNLSPTGVISADGMPAATDAAQGAVKLAAGSSGNTLGSAAMQPATAFDPAGSAAGAQSGAEGFAANAANNAQNNAEIFASNASNITSGTLDTARLGGIDTTITTAPLTLAGAPGSMTFTNGLLTAEVPAT